MSLHPSEAPLSVTVAEAARMLGLSTYTIYDLTKKGVIASRKHGARVLVDYQSLLSFHESLPSNSD